MARLLKILFPLCAFTILLSACQSKSKKSEGVATGASATHLKIQEAWSSSGLTVQKITLSPANVIRNVAWGQAMESLPEKLELSENQPTKGKSYTLYLDSSDLNFADITYIPDEKNKVKEINIDVFLEEKEQVKTLIKEFQTYFNVKMGPSSVQGTKTLWGPNQQTRVTLEDVSTAKDPGIKLVFVQVP